MNKLGVFFKRQRHARIVRCIHDLPH
jgi:hypothetical protein